MRKLFSSGLLLGSALFVGVTLIWNSTPAYAQRCGKPPLPACPTAVPQAVRDPIHPNLSFGESAPFLPIPVDIPPTETAAPPPPPSTNTPVPPTSTPRPVPPTSTNTPLPTATATSTSAPTPTITPTPFASSIVLNELLPKARARDWNHDGVENTNDEWFELYNTGSTADLSSWRVDTGEKTLGFTIPTSTTIASHGFLVYYRSQTHLALDAASQLRLLHPDGSIADAIQYTQLDDDRVHARAIDGIGPWRLGCAPSPGTANCQLEANAAASFAMPYFRETIASPTNSFNPAVVMTNILLAIILALAMGFFGNLLNDAMEAHEEHVARLLGPITTTSKHLRRVSLGFDNWMNASRLAWLGFMIKLAVILILYGAVLAFLDPSFGFITQDGLMLIIALGVSTGLIGLVDDIISYIVLRSRGGSGVIRMHSGNFLVVVASTLFSRLSGIVPGLVLGSPAGIEEVNDPGVGKYLDVLGILATALVALGAWFLAPLFSNNAWLNTVFLLIFAAGVQTAFFEMVPIGYLHGKGIFQLNRLVWLALFAALAAIFLQTMLNPNGAFVSAFNSPNMVALSIIVLCFCVFCTGVWFYLQRLDKKTETA